MRKIGLFAAASAFTVLANLGSAAAVEYLNNGGFESGDFTGWSFSDSSGFTSVQSSGYTPQSGAYYVYAGPYLVNGTLSQTFADNAGESLTISGWAIADSFGLGSVTYFFNGTSLGSPDLSSLSWTQSTFSVTATGSDTFTVVFRNDTSYNGLDGFSVASTPSGVPELPTWALALAGFAALGLLRRRARTA